MTDKYRSDLTEGNVGKMMIIFAMPFLFAQILQALYSVADMLIVGLFMGDTGISAVNISSTMTMFITYLVSGFALSGTVLVAQYIGAKQEEEAKVTIGTIFTLFIFLSVIITIAGLFLTGFLLEILNTPTEAYEEARNYFIICFSGTFFICGYNAVSAILRGLGDSKRPLMFVAIAAVTNVILDLLFVGPLKWGAGGAALATIIAQGLSFVLAIRTLYKQNFIFDFKLKSFKIDKSKLPLIFKIGLPSALQSTINNFSYLFVISQINIYGIAASTAAGIGAKIDSFAILPTLAIAQAVASMAGQNLGAQKYDRAKETMMVGLKMSIVFSVSIFIFVRVFSSQLVGMFGCGPETLEIGILYLDVLSYAYLANAVVFIVNGLANGSGNSIFVLLNAVVGRILGRIPLTIILANVLNMGLFGIFLSMTISQFLCLFPAAYFYFSGKWKKSMVNNVILEE